jgi:hypothetical protein
MHTILRPHVVLVPRYFTFPFVHYLPTLNTRRPGKAAAQSFNPYFSICPGNFG